MSRSISSSISAWVSTGRNITWTPVSYKHLQVGSSEDAESVDGVDVHGRLLVLAYPAKNLLRALGVTTETVGVYSGDGGVGSVPDDATTEDGLGYFHGELQMLAT